MQRVGQFIFLGLALAPMMVAGNVYGTIRESNRPLSGIPVVMTCGRERVPGKTDGEGVYRVFARATGACQLVVDLPNRRISAPVYSFDRPTAYNFDVVRDGNNWILRKR